MGDWLNKYAATIQAVSAVVTVGVTALLARYTRRYMNLTKNLVDAATAERTDRLETERREQAKNVGGYIEFASLRPEGQVLVLVVVNASQLPIRDVRGIVMRKDVSPPAVVATFSPIPVVDPGSDRTQVFISPELRTLALEMQFDDDAGVRWSKYGTGGPLVEAARPVSTVVEYSARLPTLTIETLPAADLGDGRWRLTLMVRNDGYDGEFEVLVLRGVEGHPNPDYGPFNLQWENSANIEQSIPRDGEHRVEIGEFDQSEMMFAFLGPASSYSGGGATRWAGFEAPNMLKFRLQIRDRSAHMSAVYECKLDFSRWHPEIAVGLATKVDN
jgi:hypothetical protein